MYIFSLIVLVFSLNLSVNGRTTREAEYKKEDKVACTELREEYIRICTGENDKRRSQKDKDFCNAFENICFSIPEGEPDKAAEPIITTTATAPVIITATEHQRSFTRFCKEFKNRYLYVCPDPFRFGQKAIVFCPVYSEKCQVPLPDKPVVPQRKSRKKSGSGYVDQLCRSYRGFALNYCNNPFLTAQSQYRAACDKYWRFCGKFHRNG